MSDQEIEVVTRGEAQTRALGRRLARSLDGPATISLDGELGSGKTRLVQGLAEGLGIDPAEVSSPTFVLCHLYQGQRMLAHVDAYRMRSVEEFEELATHESLADGGVLVVEWGPRVAAALDGDRIDIVLKELDAETRRIVVRARGPSSAAALRRLAAS